MNIEEKMKRLDESYDLGKRHAEENAKIEIWFFRGLTIIFGISTIGALAAHWLCKAGH